MGCCAGSETPPKGNGKGPHQYENFSPKKERLHLSRMSEDSSPPPSQATNRRDSDVGFVGSLGVSPCPDCGEMVNARLLDCCPLLPSYAPALGKAVQRCPKCCTGLRSKTGIPSRLRLAKKGSAWDKGCGARKITPEWTQCGGRGQVCDDCESGVCGECLKFLDAGAKIITWLRDCTAEEARVFSPKIRMRAQRTLRQRVSAALHDGFHQAVWEAIDKAVERRARRGQADRSDPLDGTFDNLQQDELDSGSSLVWPKEGMLKLRQRSPREAELQHQKLQRAVAGDETVPQDYILGLLREGSQVLSRRKNVQRTELAEASAKCVVVGDLHGQLRDLLYLLEEHGLPREGKTTYVFNGDFVDRGNRGCEVVAVVLSLLVVNPDAVFINRGNHECLKLSSAYNFRAEVELKYGPGRVFQAYCQFFSTIPLCTVVCDEVLVVHAGIPRDPSTSFDQINALERRTAIIPDSDGSLIADLVWSDPVDTLEGWRPNHCRGAGIL
eukprot:Hpha_TRINITY_DN18885_c0_g1::TRINITY_DN18885_c0_g1_i1::g.26374::m.26374